MTTKRLPTLVTYRSAEALRDDGIGYGYRKAAMHFSLLVAVAAGGFAQVQTMSSGTVGNITLVLLLIAAAAATIAFYCGKTAEYPHFPRLTLEELEAMREEMALPPAVCQQTENSVLIGSAAEIRAMNLTDSLLERVRSAASTPKAH